MRRLLKKGKIIHNRANIDGILDSNNLYVPLFTSILIIEYTKYRTPIYYIYVKWEKIK